MFDYPSVEWPQDSNAVNRNPLKGQQALFVGWNLEESDPSKENFNGDPAFWLLGS
jgi:hypothetical protein